MAIGILRTFMHQASAQGARSTALSVLLLSLGTVLSGFLMGVYLKATPWVLGFLAAMAAINFIAFIFSYIYLLFWDRDALRSERFTLSKMAMEKSLTGDSITGFRMLALDDHAPGTVISENSSGEGDKL